MNILFVTIAWPENGGRNIYTDLMDEFVTNQHEVYIVCARERKNGLPTEYTHKSGYHTLRVRCGNIQKTSVFEKGFSLALLNHQLNRSLKKYFNGIKFDLIICSTPPITLSPLVAKLKSYHESKVYLLLKDMWPQGPVDIGAIRKGSLTWHFFRHKEKKMYRQADFIGCMSPAGVSYLLKHNSDLNSSHVEVCPNSIRPNRTIDQNRGLIRSKYDIPEDAVVLLFGGNLGRPQGLSFLSDAIKALKDDHEVYFLIVGSGTHYQMLKEKIEVLRPANAALYKRLPKQEYDQLTTACDIGLLLLDRKYTIPHFPSRLLSYLDAGMPVLAAVNKDTDVGEILESTGCGLSVLHGDIDGFVTAVRNLVNQPEQIATMGLSARKLLEEKYSSDIAYQIIMRHFNHQS